MEIPRFKFIDSRPTECRLYSEDVALIVRALDLYASQPRRSDELKLRVERLKRELTK